jgi:hypothetical protein
MIGISTPGARFGANACLVIRESRVIPNVRPWPILLQNCLEEQSEP